MPNADRSTPTGREVGGAYGAEHLLDHVALGGDQYDALPGAGRSVGDAQRVKVQHGILERHRYWSAAWKRTAAASAL